MSFDKYKEKGAYHWTWYYKDKLDWYVKAVDRVVEFCQGSTLDLGCGEGLVTMLVDNATGIDIEPEAIELARQLNPTGRFRCHDLKRPFPGSWDYLACLNVIEHLPDPRPIVHIFRKNITKAGIIITDYPQPNPSSHHLREYTPEQLADVFKEWRVVPFEINKDFHGIEVYK